MIFMFFSMVLNEIYKCRGSTQCSQGNTSPLNSFFIRSELGALRFSLGHPKATHKNTQQHASMAPTGLAIHPLGSSTSDLTRGGQGLFCGGLGCSPGWVLSRFSHGPKTGDRPVGTHTDLRCDWLAVVLPDTRFIFAPDLLHQQPLDVDAIDPLAVLTSHGTGRNS